jgi:hypothetical protein
MTEKRKLEYFLLRYVPDAVKGEFVNIGLVMTEVGGNGGGFVGVHFTKDWRRARCHDAEIDTEMLEALGRELQNRLIDLQQQPVLLRQMMESYSNIVQLSEVQRCMAADPERELRDLASVLVENLKVEESGVEHKSGKTSGRKWIHAQMTDEFKSRGVWDFLDRDLPVTTYTNEADDFTFDFAYNIANRETKLFQAISLAEKIKDAELFAFRVARIGPAMATMRHMPHTFTAVVEDSYDEAEREVISVLAQMNAEQIKVARLREMPQLALRAKEELGV